MMLRILRCLAIVAALAAAPATAQDGPPIDRQALAERYIALSVGDNLGKSIEAYVGELLAAEGEAEPGHVTWAEENLPGLILAMVDDLMRQLAPIYAEVLTEEELEALIAFYETPIGREVARKTVILSVQTEPLVQAAIERYVGEFATKFCARFECADDGAGVSYPK
jgi:hypothetical protein